MITNKVEMIDSIPVMRMQETMPTWRDELAKTAMQSLVLGYYKDVGVRENDEALAKAAYRMADAMIREREEAMTTFLQSLAGGIVGGVIGVAAAFAVVIYVMYREPINE
jgi:SAM-dependent MidA family methyltransferase